MSHRKQRGGRAADPEALGSARAGRERSGRMIALGTAAIVVAVAAVTYALAQRCSVRTNAAEVSTARVQAPPPAAPGAQVFRVISVTPPAGARHVNGAVPVRVAFSAPLAANSPAPTLSPRVSGQWHQAGATMVFTPDTAFHPSTEVTVRVPAGQAGIRSAAGGLLAAPLVARFSTSHYSRLRLSELLSQLGYLPVKWAPYAGGRMAGQAASARTGLAAQIAMAYSPPAGRFSWDKGYPAALRGQWRPGAPNLLVTGAVMAFESQHGMPADGVASPAVWSALFTAARRGRDNRHGYTYALASKSGPETLTVWHDGRVVLRSLANTGIPVAPTVDGTFPVYLRFRFQIMTGVNPDGTPYADPVSFVAYFNGGDAVHYFPRGSYGFEQSLGCVELPLTSAAQAWPYLTYGSLVTVAG
jgi:peptidoglycan hydrolase-like protein with peptidoglycan-binding domain